MYYTLVPPCVLVFSFHKTKAEATRALAVFEDLCESLGVKLKLAKKVEAAQNITLIGWVFDSVAHTISLSHDKRLKIISLCRKYLNLKFLSLLQLQILGGNLNHAAAVIPGSSLRLQWCGRATSMASRYKKYVLSNYDKRQIYWWYFGEIFSPVRVQKHFPKICAVSRHDLHDPYLQPDNPTCPQYLDRCFRFLWRFVSIKRHMVVLCLATSLGPMLYLPERTSSFCGGSGHRKLPPGFTHQGLHRQFRSEQIWLDPPGSLTWPLINI